MTRFRNALLAKPGSDADFNWTPANVPADFAQEHAPVPTALAQWRSLTPDGDVLTHVLGIARALPRHGPSIEQEQGPVPTQWNPKTRRSMGTLSARTVDRAHLVGQTPPGRTNRRFHPRHALEDSEYRHRLLRRLHQVFSALAYASGIPVRQWSFSFEGFGGLGHIFNEIWDAEQHAG